MFYFITFATSHDRYSYINKANFNDFSLHYSALTTKQKYTLPHIELSPPPPILHGLYQLCFVIFLFLVALFFLSHRKATNSKKNHSKLTTTSYFMPYKGGKIKFNITTHVLLTNNKE
jgi:hypothetical protein